VLQAISRLAAVGLIALFTVQFTRAADPVELLKYIPKPVNTVAVVNVADILATPRAAKEGWAKVDHTEFLAGAIPVHPSVQFILLAKDLNPEAPGRGEVLAVIPLNRPVNLEQFAKSRGGQVDTVAGESVAVTPTGVVGVKLADTILGLARTENRQDVARWIRYAEGASRSQQQRYINAAVNNLGTRHHVLIAVETEDLFHPNQAGLAVAQSDVLAKDRPTAEAIEAFLRRMTGVRFTANIRDDGIAAEVRIDSAAPANVNPEAVRAFVAELLARNGAMLDDLPAARAAASGNAVTLTFRLSDPELARIMALVAPPIQGIGSADIIPVAPAGVTPEATQRYFRAVTRVIDDLKAQNKRARDFEKTAVWHDTAANQIETLPVLNVDPLVVEFGHGTAQRLREIANSLRGVPVQAAILESKVYAVGFVPRVTVMTPWGPRFNPWIFGGPQSLQTNLPQIRQQQTELIRQDAENREQLWYQIETQRATVRREIAEKYHLDVEAPPKR
jgi:hypothetical protein